MTKTDHAGMWDCIEDENTKRVTYRATGWDDVTHIEVLECRDCGGRHVAETRWGDQMGDLVDYGDADVDDILADYELD